MVNEMEKAATEIRRKIIRMAYKSKGSHIGPALSIVDILAALYFRILKINPEKPGWDERDRFILSKGHSASALYATLAQRGFFPESVLDEYCADGGRLEGHTNLNCVPGVEATTGSLGHGLPIGAGMALAGKCDKKDYHVYVLMGDGECDEGSVWEAAMFASQHKLDNLVVIIDYNKLQAFGNTKDVINLEPFSERLKSFGWRAVEINGHDFLDIIKALENVPFEKGKPSVVIAHTIKGKGISFMENMLEWHYKSLNEELYKKAIGELKNEA